MLLKRARRVRPPLVYIAIGLPERLERLRVGADAARCTRGRSRRRPRSSPTASTRPRSSAPSWPRTESRRASSSSRSASTSSAFAPSVAQASSDVVMVGADPHRDVELFLAVAAEMPSRSFRLVTTADRARTLGSPPPNVEVEADIPFDAMRRRLEEARVVALPVRRQQLLGGDDGAPAGDGARQSRWSSRARRRSRAATASSTATTAGSSSPATRTAFRRALAGVLRDEWHARALGARARTDRRGRSSPGIATSTGSRRSPRRMRSTAGCAPLLDSPCRPSATSHQGVYALVHAAGLRGAGAEWVSRRGGCRSVGALSVVGATRWSCPASSSPRYGRPRDSQDKPCRAVDGRARRSTRRSFARETLPTSRSSTTSSRLRPAAATSSSARSCASSSGAASRWSTNRISRRDARVPLQLVQLRLRAASPVRARGLPDGAPRRRADRRRTAASTTGRTRGSPRSTPSSPTRRCSSRATASRSTPSSGSSSAIRS